MEIFKDRKKVYIKDESGRMIAFIMFPRVDDNTVNINRTVVDPSLRGQGIAGKLMEVAYEVIKEQGLKAIASCSYAAAWFEKHPDKKDILA